MDHTPDLSDETTLRGRMESMDDAHPSTEWRGTGTGRVAVGAGPHREHAGYRVPPSDPGRRLCGVGLLPRPPRGDERRDMGSDSNGEKNNELRPVPPDSAISRVE
jgi:hypothetical protein